MQCEWYGLHEIDSDLIQYVVMIAEYKDQIIIIRNKQRKLWELPGGKREPNEDLNQAASRELYEETGAIRFELIPFAVYLMNGSYGMMFFANVNELDELPNYEIAEIQFVDSLPENLLYGPVYYEMYSRWMEMKRRHWTSIKVEYAGLIDSV